MNLEYMSREEQLSLPPKVFLDVSDAPLLNGVKPIDNPRAYGMTDEEALEWNRRKALGLVGMPTIEDIQKQRRIAYSEISDPLYFGWQRGENTEQDWLDAIESIKQEYPYPEIES